MFPYLQGKDFKVQPRQKSLSDFGAPRFDLYYLQLMWSSSVNDLQRALERFTDECETAGMKTGTSKSEAMVLCQRLVAHSGGGVVQVQVCWGLVHE